MWLEQHKVYFLSVQGLDICRGVLRFISVRLLLLTFNCLPFFSVLTQPFLCAHTEKDSFLSFLLQGTKQSYLIRAPPL
jgi:hypothetical protein